MFKPKSVHDRKDKGAPEIGSENGTVLCSGFLNVPAPPERYTE